MKFDLSFDETFPQDVEKVWAALTDASALGQWLLETDFQPVEGRRFQMWCTLASGERETYHCRVLALEPPRRMSWSWRLDGQEGETFVDFDLEPAESGCRLTIRHRGDRDEAIIRAFKGGWPAKFKRLREVLSGA